MILMCANIQRKILMVGGVGAPESLFWDWKLRSAHFVNIRSALNNIRFNLNLIAKEIEDSVIFVKYVKIGLFEHL